MKYFVKTVINKEIDWNSIPKANISVYKWNKEGITYPAFGQMVLVKGYGFIIKLTALEKNPPICKYANDGDPVSNDSALEAFIRFDDEGYINLETNCSGARKQGFRQDREHKIYLHNNAWGGFDTKTTINKNDWTVLIDIPFKKLFLLYKNINETTFISGYTFSGNFHKVHEEGPIKNIHFGMWQELFSEKPDYHLPNQFGTIIIE